MPIRRPTVHWFLPDEPDVLGGLRTQMSITVSGMEAFAAWAAGAGEAAERVRETEHQADEAKRRVRSALLHPATAFASRSSADRASRRAPSRSPAASARSPRARAERKGLVSCARAGAPAARRPVRRRDGSAMRRRLPTAPAGAKPLARGLRRSCAVLRSRGGTRRPAPP